MGWRRRKWCHGTLRHAVQHAQQSVHCVVFPVSELCTHCGMAQDFGITCCDTDHHKKRFVFCTNTAPVSSSIALCLVGFGVLSWFSNPVPRPVTVHCQCSDSTLEPLLVDQPRSNTRWSNGPSCSVCLRSRFVLGQRCSSRVVSLLGRHVQFGQGLTRAPLYEAPEGTVIRFPRPRSLSQ